MTSSNPALTLAVHPAAKGFGWVIFEGDGPVDWGIATARTKHNARSMKRFARLLDHYQPSTLVLEAFEGPEAHRGERIQMLAKEMRGAAAVRDIATYVYHRADIGRTLLSNSPATRQDIANAVAKRLPFLEPQLPKARRLWTSEDARQPLFDAVALALTHLTVRGR